MPPVAGREAYCKGVKLREKLARRCTSCCASFQHKQLIREAVADRVWSCRQPVSGCGCGYSTDINNIRVRETVVGSRAAEVR